MPVDTDLIDYFQQNYSGLSVNAILRAVSIVTLHQTEIPIGIKINERYYQIEDQAWKGSSFYKIANNG
jgi:hypothetical protein